MKKTLLCIVVTLMMGCNDRANKVGIDASSTDASTKNGQAQENDRCNPNANECIKGLICCNRCCGVPPQGDAGTPSTDFRCTEPDTQGMCPIPF